MSAALGIAHGGDAVVIDFLANVLQLAFYVLAKAAKFSQLRIGVTLPELEVVSDDGDVKCGISVLSYIAQSNNSFCMGNIERFIEGSLLSFFFGKISTSFYSASFCFASGKIVQIYIIYIKKMSTNA